MLTLGAVTENLKLEGRLPVIRNIYAHGSRVFGTASVTSDHDYIIVEDGEVGKEDTLSHNGIDATVYDCKRFRQRIEDHEISVLECLLLTQEHILKKELEFSWQLDRSKLRESLSAKASNSFVKAKKKFEVEQQPYIAKKSLWHSLRILKFGIQIAVHGRIIDFSEANDLWKAIVDNPSVVWEDYKQEYQSLYNNLKTQFRLVAPK